MSNNFNRKPNTLFYGFDIYHQTWNIITEILMAVKRCQEEYYLMCMCKMYCFSIDKTDIVVT